MFDAITISGTQVDRRKWQWFLRILVFAVIAALVGIKGMIRHQYLEFEAHETLNQNAAAAIAAPLRAALDKLRNETIQEVETRFHAEGPIVRKDFPDRLSRLEFTDFKSGWAFKVWFRDGRISFLEEASAGSKYFDDRKWQAFRETLVWVRRTDGFLWLIVLGFWLNLPAQRRHLVEVLCGLSLICIACFALDCDLGIWIQIKKDNPSVWACVVMLLVSLILVVLPSRRASQRSNCRVCGYDLTGNASGVCPECGTALSRRTAAGSDEIARELSAMQKPVDSVEA